MDEQPAQDLIQKIIDSASPLVLRLILEKHCKLQFTDRGLEIVFQSKNEFARKVLHFDIYLLELQRIVPAAVGRDIEFHIIDALAPNGGEESTPKTNSPAAVDASERLLQPTKEEKFITWKGLRFRSQTEVRIAEQLDRRKVLFFPNCKGRLGIKDRENREPDFLVCCEGKWGILEVDGPDSHPPGSAAEDHERGRLFKQHGILMVEHFDASECWENADGVVKTFLSLLRSQK